MERKTTYIELHNRPDFAKSLTEGDVLMHLNEDTGFKTFVKFIKFHEDKNDYYLFFGEYLNGENSGQIKRNFYTHKFINKPIDL